MTPDVLYRVRGSRKNEELRYSLRSLSKLEHGDVWIVGDVPPWVRGVKQIEGARYTTKWHGLVGDLLIACEQLSGKTLLLMDDDFYVLTAGPPPPVVHSGPLKDHAGRVIGSYQRSLALTYQYLVGQGIKEPLSYELHIPMVIKADKMAEVLWPVATEPMQARSLYGNLAHLGGKLAADVKARRTDPIPGGRWLSSQNFLGPIAPLLQQTFPEAGPYEQV